MQSILCKQGWNNCQINMAFYKANIICRFCWILNLFTLSHLKFWGSCLNVFSNPIQEGEREKTWARKVPSPASFSPVISPNVRISPQNCLTFSFNHFATLMSNVNAAHSTSPKLLKLKQDASSKKSAFLVKYEFFVLMSSLTEMLLLPNFSRII